jgi:hypothetical protein
VQRWLQAVTVTLSVIVGAGPATADDGELDPVLEATMHLKVQSYDRKLGERIRKGYVVAVLHRPGSRPSEALARKMVDAFTRVAEKWRIKTLKPTIVMIAADPKLLDSLRAADTTLIYVTSGLDEDLPQIVAAGAALRAPTVTSVRAHVAAGIGIGIVVHQRKPRIVINLKAIQASGMELDAEMLGLAEVLR